MQNNIDIFRWSFRRNVLEPESLAAARKIDNQRPIEIAVAISPHDGDPRSDYAQFVQDSLRADIAQVPDFIRAGGEIDNRLGQFVMGIGQDENLHSTNSRTTNTTGTKLATSIFVVAFVRGLSLHHVI